LLNQEQTFSLDLSLFGSKVSDLNAANLPAGVSPDNNNVFFYPQGVATRPAFIHALANPFSGASYVMSHAPYTPPGGGYYIVALDDAQNIWEYNVVEGTALKLFTLSKWLSGDDQKYFNSAQLFDKFFMAFFDPWNGLNQYSTAADIPRYVNPLGHCNRVTIDGPGGGLSVTNENLENLLTSMTVASNFERTGNIVTVTLSGTLPNPLPIPGWFIQLYDKNAAIPSYNESSSWNRSNPLNSAAVQSATVGGNTPGNIVWVFYDVSSSYGGSIDNTLYDAFTAAQAGGYTLYVKITNPVVGPAGVFPVAYVASSSESAIPAIPNQTDSRTWYYFGYQVPGAPSWQGNVSISPSTSATYAYSTTPITPTGGDAAGTTFSGNQLYQSLDDAASLSSDGSGVTRVNTSVAVANLPIGGWIYLVLPSGSDLPFATGWVQVASVVNNKEFSISTPGAQIFSTGGVTLYEYWGSLNTNVNLAQPVPGNPVGTSYAQVGAQGFQITAVSESGGDLIISWYQLGPDDTNEGSAGTYALTPQSAEVPGNRQAFCFFVNEDSAPSPGSPPINFTTLGGPNFTKFTFPLGPNSTVQRALAVTPANGADFFTLPPANVPSSAGPIITPGMILYDNSTTSAYIDWSDQALVASIPTSGPGAVGEDYGDLTSTINLPPCLGVIAYDDALGWIGEWNNVKNFINLSFQGGVAALSDGAPDGPPLGWDNSTEYNSITPDGASTLISASDNSGWALQFTNSSGNHNGMISQGAYQDIWGAPILQPNQTYEVVCRTQAISGDTAGATLNFIIYSPSQGVLASATVTQFSSPLHWITPAVFSAAMPAQIPSDTRLLVYTTWSTDGVVAVADIFIINANSPVLTNQIRFSYPTNPFGYDNENGFIVITAEPDPIVSMFKQRKYLYALTTKSLLQTFDTGEVPSEWGLEVFAMNCGGAGPNAVDSQSDIAWWIGQHGAQIFDGSKPKKISQEIEPDVDAINWEFANIISVASDPIQRVIYFSVPVDDTVSNTLLTMNHRMTDPSVNITDPIHVSSYTGKMIATDLARKWSPWDVSYNSLAMCYIINADELLVQAMTFGAGYTSSGYSPTTYGEIYYQDFVNYPPGNPATSVWNTTDDDTGTFESYYDTYFFFAHDIEQNAMLALYRKLFCYMSTHVVGTGSLTITPSIDALSNFWTSLPALTLQVDDPGVDYEFGLNVSGNRMSLEYYMPSGGFWLTHLIVSARRDLVFPVGGVL